MAEFPLVPISKLTRWNAAGKMIRGRVITKSALRTYAVPPNGEDVMFSFTISDGAAKNQKIEVVTFSDEARERFDTIALNEYYSISNFVIDYPKERKYSLTSFNFVLKLTDKTQIDVQIPKVDYNIRPIALFRDGDDAVNVMGICSYVGELVSQSVICRDVDFREIRLIDSSGEVKVKLWANEARDFDLEVGKVIYLYGARLSPYMGQLKLGTVMNSMMLCEGRDLPEDIPGLQELKDWWQENKLKLMTSDMIVM